MNIDIYNPQQKTIWNEFILNSKNGTFLHNRDFMEYHSHRFSDHSLLFWDNGNLIGIMPGHIEGDIYYSHKGLTYGGLVMSYKTTATDTLSIFDTLVSHLQKNKIKQIIYKTIPHIYHSIPAEEDLYALFKHNASLIERNISSTIQINNLPGYNLTRKRGLKKAMKSEFKIELSHDYSNFWEILSSNLLNKYNTFPVHTLEEITYLNRKFPDQIRLYTVLDNKGELMAGCVIFETQTLVHAQYTAATEWGKKNGAIDMLIDYIIHDVSKDKKYFDYGISTENHGLTLNEKLIYQKESFGGRAIVYDTYSIDL